MKVFLSVLKMMKFLGFGVSINHPLINFLDTALKFTTFFLSNWFVDNNLSIHFGKDKTKCILFSRDKNLPELNITYNNNRIKQYRMVE